MAPPPAGALRAVLGIDAAWTLSNPSGVALVVEDLEGWRLVANGACYESFCRLGTADGEAPRKPAGPALSSVLAGRAKAYGDDDAAIWVPSRTS